MPLDLAFLRSLQQSTAAGAWPLLFGEVQRRMLAPLPASGRPSTLAQRDWDAAALDHYHANAAWDLWRCYPGDVPTTADALVAWWSSHGDDAPRSVLILDGFSLREAAILLAEAPAHGIRAQGVSVTAAPLPPDTTSFAQALAASQRSALENNGKPKAFRLPDAWTESSRHPWADCADLVRGRPNVFFWHEWPDQLLHVLGKPGAGLERYLEAAERELHTEDFWGFVRGLARGGRLLVTSDHGYAVSGKFQDAEGNEAKFLRATFEAKRHTRGEVEIPPAYGAPLELASAPGEGAWRLVLGRRKWKVPGGFPTLSHGGLTLLEVAVPFLELVVEKT